MVETPNNIKTGKWELNFVNKNKEIRYLEKHACQNAVAMDISTSEYNYMSYQFGSF